jgi:alanyl-tRNA synthetase
MTRVHFVCGLRALRDYRAAGKTADAIALKFSVGREEAEASVSRLLDENKRLSRRVRELAGLTAKAEAQQLIESVGVSHGWRILARIFDDRDFEELKLLAHRLVDGAGVVALLAVKEGGVARMVFARSADVEADMNALMKTACERLGGRGGGKPDFAQGGGSKTNELNSALEAAKAMVIDILIYGTRRR